jgi:predicted nucleotidyltransferase
LSASLFLSGYWRDGKAKEDSDIDLIIGAEDGRVCFAGVHHPFLRLARCP